MARYSPRPKARTSARSYAPKRRANYGSKRGASKRGVRGGRKSSAGGRTVRIVIEHQYANPVARPDSTMGETAQKATAVRKAKL